MSNDASRTRLDAANEGLQRLVDGLPVGERLPTERELMEQLGVGRSTLREAISRLVVLGRVRVVHGRGMFVAAGAPPEELPPDVEGLLNRSARVAVTVGLSETEFVSEAESAYRVEAARRRLVSVVGPLPADVRTGVAELVEASGGTLRECSVGDLEIGGLVVAAGATVRTLQDAGHDVIPVGAALRVDLTVALSSIPQGGTFTVCAPDEETLAVMEETVRSLRPDVDLNAQAGPASVRAGLSDAERRVLARRLRQPAAGRPAAGASRPSARSSAGSARSQSLD